MDSNDQNLMARQFGSIWQIKRHTTDVKNDVGHDMLLWGSSAHLSKYSSSIKEILKLFDAIFVKEPCYDEHDMLLGSFVWKITLIAVAKLVTLKSVVDIIFRWSNVIDF